MGRLRLRSYMLSAATVALLSVPLRAQSVEALKSSGQQNFGAMDTAGVRMAKRPAQASPQPQRAAPITDTRRIYGEGYVMGHFDKLPIRTPGKSWGIIAMVGPADIASSGSSFAMYIADGNEAVLAKLRSADPAKSYIIKYERSDDRQRTDTRYSIVDLEEGNSDADLRPGGSGPTIGGNRKFSGIAFRGWITSVERFEYLGGSACAFDLTLDRSGMSGAAWDIHAVDFATRVEHACRFVEEALREQKEVSADSARGSLAIWDSYYRITVPGIVSIQLTMPNADPGNQGDQFDQFKKKLLDDPDFQAEVQKPYSMQ